jgi:hypothetical protein
MDKLVWVEHKNTKIVRIFRNAKAIIAAKKYEDDFLSGDQLGQVPRNYAIREIRRQIYDRQEGRCLYCPKLITWAGGHMHEKVPRGKGGEISLENSVMLCADCHLNQEHGNRKPRFGK